MKKAILLSALFFLGFVSQAATRVQKSNCKDLNGPIVTMWCNTFTVSVNVGNGTVGGSISTNFTICCHGLLWQTCFRYYPKQPENYVVPVYLRDMGPKILKEIQASQTKELTVTESTVVEMEKSFYRIQKGSYTILKNESGLYVDYVMEKVK